MQKRRSVRTADGIHNIVDPRRQGETVMDSLHRQHRENLKTQERVKSITRDQSNADPVAPSENSPAEAISNFEESRGTLDEDIIRDMECQTTVLRNTGDVAFFENALGEARKTQDDRLAEKDRRAVEEDIHTQIYKAEIENAIRTGGADGR